MLTTKRCRNDDTGVALVSVLVVMLVLTMLSLAAAAVVMNTTRSLGSSRTVLQSRAAADAGLVVMVADAHRAGLSCGLTYSGERYSDPAWDGSVVCDTSAKKATFTSTGYAGSTSTKVRAVYEYFPETSGGAAKGALVSGDGGISATTVSIYNDGDLLLNNGSLNCNNHSYFGGLVGVLKGSAHVTNYCEVVGDLYVSQGDFECNSYGKIGGDVVVANGNAYVTNHCEIVGRLFVETGTLKCDSDAIMRDDVTVRTGTTTFDNNCVINGNLISRGSVKLNNAGAKVTGDVTTMGTVTITSGATVSGSVRAAGLGASNLYNATVGSTWIAGTHPGDLKVTVNGDLVIAGGATFKADTSKITGNLRLGGDFTNPGALTVGGSILKNQSGIGAPIAALPPGAVTPSSPTFTWIDFPYSKKKFEDALYTVKTLTSAECVFYSDTLGVPAFVKDQTKPTVIDARACESIGSWGRTYYLRTDIVLVVKAIDAGAVKVRSFDGADHRFSLVVPDDTDDDKPSCASGYGTMKLYAFNMESKIHGIAYSPCTIDVNNSSDTRWNGQIYGGKVEYSIGGIKLYYEPIVLPGLDTSGGGGGSTTLKLADEPIEQGDVG